MNFKKFYLTAEGWANRKRFWLLIECILAGTPGPNRFGPAGNTVFCDVEGRPLSPRGVTLSWRRVLVSKGLPVVTFHALRHTHVSLLLAEGVNILTISRRVGHAKTSLTLDTTPT